MNRIYKVIWSKVKHQYVVVSELAHRDGKRSSAANKSIKTMLATLAVCGVLGVFAGLPTQQVFAAGIGGETVAAQYVAIKFDSNTDDNVNPGGETKYFYLGNKRYRYHKEKLPGTDEVYWVRDGYSIKVEYGYRFPKEQGDADNKQIIAYKTNASADTSGLLQSNQVMIDTSLTSSGDPVTTYTGSVLNDVEIGTYVGAVNNGRPEVPSTFNYYIEDDNGKYIDAGGDPTQEGQENHFAQYFVEAKPNADGSYTVNINGEDQVVSRDNLYVINDKISNNGKDNYKIGVFTTTSGKIYTGRVFGKYNEVLMTAQDEKGKYYSYWAANTDDPNAPLTGMTIGQLNTSLKEIDTNSRKLAGDDIKQIDVKANSGGNAGGTIGLLRRGTYNEATGKWGENQYAPGTINVTSKDGTNGKDVAIKFANNGGSFTVDAGSKVVGKVDGQNATSGDTLDGLTINGIDYKLGGGQNYTAGTNVQIDQNVISANDYRLIGSGNDGTDSYEPDDNGNIKLRVKDNKTGYVQYVTLTNIASADDVATNTANINLLKDADQLNVKYDSAAKDSVTLGGTGAASTVKLTNVAAGVNDTDAVNMLQLKNNEYDKYVSNAAFSKETGKLDLTVTNGNENGTNKIYSLDLGTYIAEKDDYVIKAEVTKGNNNQDQVVLTRKSGETVTMDISSLTGSMSTTDYRLIGSGNDGTGSYEPDDDGNIKLRVKDNKTGTTQTVTLKDIASAEDVDNQFTQVNADIDNMDTKLKHITHNDVGFFSRDYTQVEGTKLYNDGSIYSEVNSELDNSTNTFDFSKDGGKFVTKSVTSNRKWGKRTETTSTSTSEFNEDGATFTQSKVERTYSGMLDHIGKETGNETSFTKIQGKHITAGDVQVNGEDGSTITGLSNTTIDYDGFGGGRAATEAQLDAMRTKINGDLKVTASNGIVIDGENKVSVNAGAGLGFSETANKNDTKELEVKVGQNLEINSLNQVDLKDNITLGNAAGPHIQLNGTPSEKSDVVSVVDKDSQAIFSISQDGRVSSKGDVIAGGHSLFEVSQFAVRYDRNADGTTRSSVTLDSTDPYDTVKDSANHVISATGGIALKNVAYASGNDGSEAVNVDYLTTQLDKSQSTAVANERHIATSGDVNPTDGKQFDGTYAVNRADGTISLIEVDGNGALTNNTLVLKDIASATDLKNLDEGAVKYWRNEDGTYNKSYIELAGGDNGTVINHVADGAVDETSKQAVNGSQLWKVQELAGKHTTMTVNDGMEAPENGSYTTDGNLQLKQTNTDGQIKYDIKLNDDIVLGGSGESPEEQDNRVTLSGTNGTVSVTTGENTIHIGGGVITGLTNTEWSGTTTTPDRAATEGQLATLDEGAVKYWRDKNGTYDKSYIELAGGDKGTVINHVADGAVNKYSKEAVNGSQLWNVQQEAKAQHTTMTVNGGTAAPTDETYTDGNLQLQQTTGTNGQIQYDVKLNDTLLLGGQNENNIVIDGTTGSILLNSRVDGEGVHAIDIDATSGTITGLTGALTNENWTAFMKGEGGIDDTQAATESDLRLAAQHSVQYYTDEKGVIDYNSIVLGGTAYSNKSGGTMITNVAYADINGDGSAAVNVDLLNDTVNASVSSVTANEKHIATNFGPNADVPNGQFSVKDGKITLVEVNGNGTPTENAVIIDNVAAASDLGDVTQIHDGLMNKDENGNTINTSVVDAVNNLDDKVGSGNFDSTEYAGNKDEEGNYTETSITDAIINLDDAIGDLQGDIDTVSKNHTTIEAGKNINVSEDATTEGKLDYTVSLDDHITLGNTESSTYVDVNGEDGTVRASGNVSAGSFTTGDITINGTKEDGTHTGTINGLSNTTWNADAIVSGQAATEDQLKAATEAGVQYDRNEDGTVNKGSITLGGPTYNEETHEGGTTITNVADGKNASDAVNMGQLWQTNQAVINNSNNIQMLSNSVNKLDTRIDRVGAGAAALAALHPLDFDPDAKWDFAAGYGNYRGANAVAVGAYYRPNEDLMFSVGGSMGGGENMVNAGVSLKIGAGSSNVTTSRVAMAKEIKAMRDVVAKQDAQIQKLTAMVNALVGSQAVEPDTTTMFPDVPENHWAYEAVKTMVKSGLVKGYPDGEFKGDRAMTRYEFAQIVHNAIQAGVEVDARLVQEFKPELEYFHIATVAQDKDGNPTIQRVRAN